MFDKYRLMFCVPVFLPSSVFSSFREIEMEASGAAGPAHGPGAQLMDTTSEGLLVLVIDTNPAFWFPKSAANGSLSDQGFQQLISSTLVFVNAYLLLHRSNRIVIIAAHAGRSEMLYPDPEQVDTSGSAEQAAKVNARVMHKLQKMSETPMDPAQPAGQTAIAASLSRSLCCMYAHACV